MVSKQIAAVFTILGGVAYLFGSVLGTIIFGGLLYGLLGFSTISYGGPSTFNPAGFGTAVGAFLALGLGTGTLIIVGGALTNSDSGPRRKSGCILAIAMMIIGAIPAVGGFLVGFIFVLIGSVLGLTYKPNSPDIIVGVASAGLSSVSPENSLLEPGERASLLNELEAKERAKLPSALELEILRQLPQGKSVDEVSKSTGVSADIISEKFGKLQAAGLINADHMLTERGYNLLRESERNSS